MKLNHEEEEDLAKAEEPKVNQDKVEDCSESEYNTFLAFRESRVKRGEAHFDSFWKNVQFVAAGALGGSFTLLNATAPAHLSDLMLRVSWLFFAGAIVSSLLASYCSGFAIKSEIPDLDKGYRDLVNVQYSKKTKMTRWFAQLFGFLAIGAIVVGAVLMAIAMLNL